MSLPGSIGLLSRVPSPASSIYGNVDGPPSATNNAIALFDGTTGKLIKNSAYIMAGAGGTITVSGSCTLNQDVSTGGTPTFAKGMMGSGTTLTELLTLNNNTGDTFVRFDKAAGSNTFQGLVGVTQTNGNGSSGSVAGDAILRSETNVLLSIAGTTRATVTSTGLAVTGTLSTTSTLTTLGGATFHTTSSALTNGAGASTGTLTNAPAAGNPTKWIGINDNGTTRYIPAW